MRTMLGKCGAVLEQVVGLAFPQPSGSEAATRIPGAQHRDRLQEKLRGILFRYTPILTTPPRLHHFNSPASSAVHVSARLSYAQVSIPPFQNSNRTGSGQF